MWYGQSWYKDILWRYKFHWVQQPGDQDWANVHLLVKGWKPGSSRTRDSGCHNSVREQISSSFVLFRRSTDWLVPNHIQSRGEEHLLCSSSLILKLFCFENIHIRSSRNNVCQVSRHRLDRLSWHNINHHSILCLSHLATGFGWENKKQKKLTSTASNSRDLRIHLLHSRI